MAICSIGAHIDYLGDTCYRAPHAIDKAFASTLFAGLLDWFLFQDVSKNAARYQRSALLATMLLGILLNGLVRPIIEELYFRGFLLPRLARFGIWVPIIKVESDQPRFYVCVCALIMMRKR